MGDFTLANSPDTLSPCQPFARHPISLSLYCQDILSACHPIPPDTLPIAWTPYLTHPISLTPYLTLILFHSPYLTLTLSHSPYLTHTLSHSHPICESPYRPCAQEVTEGMLELERSRIKMATELEQLHDQKDNLQEHLSVLKHTLVVVTLCMHVSSRVVTLRHACVSVFFLRFVALLNDHFPAMKKNVIEIYILLKTWFILLVKIIILIKA